MVQERLLRPIEHLGHQIYKRKLLILKIFRNIIPMSNFVANDYSQRAEFDGCWPIRIKVWLLKNTFRNGYRVHLKNISDKT